MEILNFGDNEGFMPKDDSGVEPDIETRPKNSHYSEQTGHREKGLASKRWTLISRDPILSQLSPLHKVHAETDWQIRRSMRRTPRSGRR